MQALRRAQGRQRETIKLFGSACGTGAGACADMASVASAYRFAGNESIDLAQLTVSVNGKATPETVKKLMDGCCRKSFSVF